MPPIAVLGAGLASGIAGSIFNQRAANKGVRPVNPGAYNQALSGLSGLATSGFGTLNNLITTGMPVDTGAYESSLGTLNNIQTQQGSAAIREQFGASGLGNSSPAAVGLGNYLTTQNANFLNTINQLRYQSATDAINRQLQASEFGISSFLGPATQLQGPKGSVIGAGLSQGGSDLSTLAFLMQLGMFGGGGIGGGGGGG